eukprot:jgi/Picre1/31221/NNA_006575.t1
MNAAQHIRILDGGTGEELFKNWQVPDDRMIWSAIAVKEERYHEAFEAGSSVFFKGWEYVCDVQQFRHHTWGWVFRGFNQGVESDCWTDSRDAVSTFADMYGVEREVLGSLPPLVESYRPDKVMGHDEGRRVYKECIVDVMDEYVDGWLAETLSSSEKSSWHCMPSMTRIIRRRKKNRLVGRQQSRYMCPCASKEEDLYGVERLRLKHQQRY